MGANNKRLISDKMKTMAHCLLLKSVLINQSVKIPMRYKDKSAVKLLRGGKGIVIAFAIIFEILEIEKVAAVAGMTLEIKRFVYKS